MIAQELLDARSKLEERLQKLTGGAGVFASESDIFAMSCGCIGAISYIQGLQLEDVEVYHDELKNLIEDFSRNLGIFPSVSYAQMKPGKFDLERLQAHDLCDSCKKEYAGCGGKPWPDMILFKMDEGGESAFTDILRFRSGLEELLRVISKRPAYVMQFNIFARICGCVGVTAVVRGIFGDEIQRNAEEIVEHLTRTSEEIGIEPTVVYTTFVHGTEAVAGISAQATCKACRTTYEEYEVIPRPDLDILYFEK
ncbi:MAG: DUF5402 family protein [Candidatus Syntropharchaeales archaeon]